jgi:hypothetical protein
MSHGHQELLNIPEYQSSQAHPHPFWWVGGDHFLLCTIICLFGENNAEAPIAQLGKIRNHMNISNGKSESG